MDYIQAPQKTQYTWSLSIERYLRIVEAAPFSLLGLVVFATSEFMI